MPPPCAFPGFDAVTPASARRAQSLVVLPLHVVGNGNAQTDFLASGLTDAILDKLSLALPRLEIAGRRIGYAHVVSTAAAAKRAGAELKTKFVLTGAVSGARDGARVTFALYDAGTGSRTWSRSFPYDSVGAGPIVRVVSSEIANRVGGSLTSQETQSLERLPTQNRLAYEWALKGDAAADGAAFDRAADAFRRAIKLDRGYLDAYAKLALADADLLDEGVEKSEGGAVLLEELQSAASRAVANNPTSALAWLAEARARVLSGRAAAQWRAAFDRAVALDARNPTILEQYGRALAQTDDRTAAVDMLRRAAALIPRSAEILTTLAEIAIADRKDGEACGMLNTAIVADPLYGPAWAARALLRMRHGELRFAWADAETATKVGSGLLGEATAALVDLASHDTSRARSRLGDVMLDVSSRGTISVREGRAVASAFIAAEQMSKALDVLEAVRPRGPLYAATLRDPNFDKARRLPRFRALIAPSQAAPPSARVSGEGSPGREDDRVNPLPVNVAREHP
jgi:TolB-like protein